RRGIGSMVFIIRRWSRILTRIRRLSIGKIVQRHLLAVDVLPLCAVLVGFDSGEALGNFERLGNLVFDGLEIVWFPVLLPVILRLNVPSANELRHRFSLIVVMKFAMIEHGNGLKSKHMRVFNRLTPRKRNILFVINCKYKEWRF